MLALVSFTSLASCASQQMWYLNGKTEAQLSAASNECALYAQQAYAGASNSIGNAAYSVGAAGGAGLGGVIGLLLVNNTLIENTYEACMNNYGFVQAP